MSVMWVADLIFKPWKDHRKCRKGGGTSYKREYFQTVGGGGEGYDTWEEEIHLLSCIQAAYTRHTLEFVNI